METLERGRCVGGLRFLERRMIVGAIIMFIMNIPLLSNFLKIPTLNDFSPPLTLSFPYMYLVTFQNFLWAPPRGFRRRNPVPTNPENRGMKGKFCVRRGARRGERGIIFRGLGGSTCGQVIDLKGDETYYYRIIWLGRNI